MTVGGICISDDDEKRKVTFGYIRNCWKLDEFKEMNDCPYDVIKMIESFGLFQVIYALNRLHDSFCCVDVNSLLQTE